MWRHLLNLLREARRPLVVVDFETAGLGGKPPVEFALLVWSPWEEPQDDEETRRVARLVPPGLTYAVQMRLDPGQTIDPGATAVHKITDADVKDCRRYDDLEVRCFFQQYASGEAGDSGSGPAVWVGHNAAEADVPWAQRWGYMPGVDLDVVDTMRVVRRMQKAQPFPLTFDVMSDLGAGFQDGGSGAVAVGLDAYASSLIGSHVALTGCRPQESHGAMADACSTARVLCRLLDLWSPMWPPSRSDLPASANLTSLLAALDATPPGQMSWDGWLEEVDGGYVWARGKHKGSPASCDPSYKQWVSERPRRPSGVNGEGWCSQHTADILRGLRPMAVAR